jgi:catechol 2,3-dioxygenase-like lactoylglutathione lyase family enzyme
MIGYVVLGTNDLARAASFYDELLAEMGVTRMMEFGERGYAWGVAMDKPMLCIMTPYDRQPATVGNGVMVGISAESRDQVDRIYNKAIELGGSDEGPPGLRAEGGDGFYAAYFRDLDGNKLDVFSYDTGLGRRKFVDLLPAAAAGRAILYVIVPAGDDDRLNRLAAIRDHGCDGVGFRTGTLGVSRILDVATREKFAPVIE